jgi:hypothetical protein
MVAASADTGGSQPAPVDPHSNPCGPASAGPHEDQAVGGSVGSGARASWASEPDTLQMTTSTADRTRVVEVRPLRKGGDSNHWRTTRPLPGWGTDGCALAGQQQFAFPHMAGGRHLHRAGGCPPPQNVGGRSGSPAHTGGETRLSSPSASSQTTKILEAERWLKGADLHEATLLQRQQEQGDAGAPHPGA